MLLNISLKEEIEDISALVAVLILHALFVSYLSCFLKSLYLTEVNAGVLLYCFDHGKSFKGLAEIDHVLAVGNAGSTAYLLRNVTEHILSEVHHTVVVGISLIELHECEFGVMTGVNALVSENSAYFVNSFKSADDKSLQIEFEADTELYVLVESVIVSFKGPCSCAACVGNEHGSFNFHEALIIKIASDRCDYL